MPNPPGRGGLVERRHVTDRVWVRGHDGTLEQRLTCDRCGAGVPTLDGEWTSVPLDAKAELGFDHISTPKPGNLVVFLCPQCHAKVYEAWDILQIERALEQDES